MITIATPEDMRRAAGLANGFAGQTVYEPFFIDWWERMIKAGSATVFYRENGDQLKEALGVLIFDNPLTGEKHAALSFWFCDLDEQSMATGILFLRAKEFIKAMGCKVFHASALLDSRFTKVHSFLIDSGFVPNELQFKLTL
jgi:hypothetical protein